MAPEDPPDDLKHTVTDYKGRAVEVTERGLRHINTGHSEVRPADLLKAIQVADTRTKGRGRVELLWARNVGPSRWLVVRVAYEGGVGRVATAHASKKGPREEDLL
jgi:hypothetical protein